MRKNSDAGFTLLEVLIAVAIFSMIFIAVLAMLEGHSRVSQSGEVKADVQQNARIAVDMINRDLRHAGFFPEFFISQPLPVPGGGLSVLIGTGTALAIAGSPTLISVSPPPNPLPAGTGSQIIFYSLVCPLAPCPPNTFNLMRNVINPGPGAPPPIFQWNAGGAIVANNVLTVTFAYFSGADTPIPPLPGAPPLDGVGVPANGAAPPFGIIAARQAVRRIVVTLTINEQIPGQGVQVYTLTSDVRLRNGCAPVRSGCG